MKIVFMGTPEFAVPTLTEIVSTGHEVVAVYTRAPKPAGRGQAERRSPVHEAAEKFGIPVFTPRSLKPRLAVLPLRPKFPASAGSPTKVLRACSGLA